MNRVRSIYQLVCTGCLIAGGLVAAPLNRQANTTINLPQSPQSESHSYVLTEALNGLTFDKPVGFAVPPKQVNRLFVVERPGRIVVVTNLANPTRNVFLDITSKVYSEYEFGFVEGLSSLAFHPGYATNGYFFVTYTFRANEGGVWRNYNRLSRFQRSSANPNQGAPASEMPMITQFDEGDGHNINEVRFGPDGYLYVAIGDEGDGRGAGDEFHNAQRIDKDFFSAILRIDVDNRPGSIAPNSHSASGGNYRIPPDNPFVGATSFNGLPVNPSSVRTEFYAVGFRNPWRMSFDSATGLLYTGDVGHHGKEEINVVVKGGNYGWAYKEGTLTGPLGAPPSGVQLRDPIVQYSPGRGLYEGNAVIGGVVYRGQRIPALTGMYIFADYVSGNVWALRYQGETLTPIQRLTGKAEIGGFGIDPRNGDVLVADHFGGHILKLDYITDSPGNLPPTLADTGIFANLNTLSVHPGIVPYDLNVPFWSDNAKKRRWFSVPNPNLKIGFSREGNWTFPASSVWIKHFDLELTNGVPQSARRVETRVIVKNASGVYGVTYRWGTSTSNATLVPEEGMNETFQVYFNGTPRNQVWRYPSRNECLSCHTPAGGYAIGFNTPQLNRNFNYGTVANQIQALSSAGYFQSAVTDIQSLRALAHPSDTSQSREYRVRSYLTANCVQCHQPGAPGGGNWDARITTPLAQANIIEGLLQNYNGNPDNRVVKPGHPSLSMLLTRISIGGSLRMPPLGSSVLDDQAIQLMNDWIANDLVPPRMIGVSDFNKNGSSDLLWQQANGSLGIYFLNGATRVSTFSVRDGRIPPANWRLVGLADFNADGASDFLWQHADGRCTAWFMNGSTFSSSMPLRNGAPAAAGWRALGVGDFNADRSGDLFFQHADGRMAVWLMAGATFLRAAYIRNGIPLPPEWRVVGIGDFNADRHCDILLRHQQGNLSAWLMNGTNRVIGTPLRDGNPVSLQWRIVSVTDFNADGHVDIILQHNTGRVAVWLMNGTEVVQTVRISL